MGSDLDLYPYPRLCRTDCIPHYIKDGTPSIQWERTHKYQDLHYRLQRKLYHRLARESLCTIIDTCMGSVLDLYPYPRLCRTNCIPHHMQGGTPSTQRVCIHKPKDLNDRFRRKLYHRHARKAVSNPWRDQPR